MEHSHLQRMACGVVAACLMFKAHAQIPTPGPPSYEMFNYNPVAESGAIIVSGNARFTVLTDSLVRMEYAANGKFEDRATPAVLNRNLKVPSFTHSVTDGVLSIATTNVEVKYKVGTEFSASTLSAVPGKGADGAFKGWFFGQQDPGNLLGTIKSLDQLGAETLNCTENANVMIHGESLHCEWGLVSRSGWAVVDDGDNWGLTEGAEWWDSKNTDANDLYLFAHGHGYKSAIYDYAMIGGRVPIIPRYALGVWYTRWYDYNNLGVKDVVQRYQEHNLPLDVYVTDMNWHKKDNWGGYTFDSHLYPYPEDTFGYLHSLGIYTAANLHDANGVGSYEKMYPEMCKATGFDCSKGDSIPFSIVNKTYVYALEDIVLKNVSGELDFWWIDWQQGGAVGGAAGGKQNPTIWTNKVRVTDPKRQGNAQRGVVLARWGGLGTHRYQVGFSGDVLGLTWENLAYQPYFSLTAANVLYGFWSHDIEGPSDDHEMYTRWVQWAAFSGVLRSHDRGMSAGGCATQGSCSTVRPWEVPDLYYRHIREAMVMRSSLIPYIYNAAFEAYNSGLGLLRPMYYEYPEADAAYASNANASQYFFGNDMLVAPVVVQGNSTTGLAATSIWLPQGTWVDVNSGKQYTIADSAGTWVKKEYHLSEIPRFVRANSVIPEIPFKNGDTVGVAVRQYSDLIFTVYGDTTAASASGTGSVYEDDGVTDVYLQGAAATTTASFTSTSPTHMQVSIETVGTYAQLPKNRNYVVRFANRHPPASVMVNGDNITTWTYDGPSLTVEIPLHGVNTGSKQTIDIEFSGNAADISGFKGIFSRANLAKLGLDELRITPGAHKAEGGMIQTLSSIGDGLSFAAKNRPADVVAALKGVNELFANAQAEAAKLSTKTFFPRQFNRVLAAQGLLAGAAM